MNGTSSSVRGVVRKLDFEIVQLTLPSFDFKLFDIDFFMTTNLLLPNQKVIESKTKPGGRIPWDLYPVGQVVHKDKVYARRVARAALAS